MIILEVVAYVDQASDQNVHQFSKVPYMPIFVAAENHCHLTYHRHDNIFYEDIMKKSSKITIRTYMAMEKP